MAKIGHYYENGKSNFRVYAPKKKSVAIEIDGKKDLLPLTKDEQGYWNGSCDELPEGTLYFINLNHEISLPDPASRYQPFGIHGLSMIVKHHKANLDDWEGVKIEDAIIYELHLGTFSPQGNLRGAKFKIPYLAELGINVIELMPINTFPGNCDWGYDGVDLFALAPSYGTYEDLEAFLNEAHKYGIAVILDVVYNHFGPEGNYTNNFAPYLKKSQTPWGAAINFDQEYSAGIRDFFKQNVIWWLEDLGFDGFRLDAWAMIEDSSENRIHRELTDLAHEIGKKEKRNILVIAEHLRNDPDVVSSSANGDNCDSQWIDDFGLAIRSFLAPDPNDKQLKSFYQFDDLLTALEQAIVLDGTRFNYVLNNYTGKVPTDVKDEQNVVYIQDHDLIGNRVLGDRFIAYLGDQYLDKSLLASFTLFASNFRPMIFMGEEFGSKAPFPFFESFIDPNLIQAVKEGRKKEWKFTGKEPYDSHDPNTFALAQLKWNDLTNEHHANILKIFTKLITLKKNKIIGYKSLPSKGKAPNTIIIKSSTSLVLLNYSDKLVKFDNDQELGYEVVLNSNINNKPYELVPYSAQILLNKQKNLDLAF